MSQLTSEMWTLDQLQPYVNNARTHSDDQIKQIASSIHEFGFTAPLLIAENQILAGHARYEAAKLLGIKSVPVILLNHLTEKQRKAYVIADNNLALNAGWDYALLGSEVCELEAADFELSVLGFSEADIIHLLTRNDGKTDPHAEWNGMPEYDQENLSPYRTMLVHFADEQSVQDFAKLTEHKITEKTKYIWFPDQQLDQTADIEYADETA